MVAVVGLLMVTLVVGTRLSHAAHRTAHASRQELQQRNLCIPLGGKCLGQQRSCDGQMLPSHLCGPQGRTCCVSSFETFTKDFRKSLKRLPVRGVCLNTPRQCRKRGGKCISTNSPCNTYAAGKFCDGRSCTCCYGDHKACSPTPACKGGFCFKGNKKVCRGGVIKRSGCTGRRCSCCIPKGSQAVTGDNSGKCSCGKSNEERIVGGQVVTPPNKHPWLVGILAPPYNNYHCGGSIISSEYVLTAGHCLHEQPSGNLYDYSKIKVRVADYNQFSKKDDVKGVTQLVDVKEIITHELFVISRPYHDIGLLRLATKLDLKSHAQMRAVCLPSNAAFTYEGAIGVASGWGVEIENSNVVADVAREVSVPILGPTCRNTQFGDVILTSNMLCAGTDEGGKDTCLGDSGGPFTVEVNNHHDLVGITSFGIGCGKKNSPGVYTRITAYLPWISSKTRDTGPNTCN